MYCSRRAVALEVVSTWSPDFDRRLGQVLGAGHQLQAADVEVDGRPDAQAVLLGLEPVHGRQLEAEASRWGGGGPRPAPGR